MSHKSTPRTMFDHHEGICLGPGPFDYYPSTEGVDSTFEVVCTTTNLVVARFRYWDRKVESELEARNMALTLNALRQNMLDEQSYDEDSIVHDAGDGINWHAIDFASEHLFGPEPIDAEVAS